MGTFVRPFDKAWLRLSIAEGFALRCLVIYRLALQARFAPAGSPSTTGWRAPRWR
jgi:hypothetical protein